MKIRHGFVTNSSSTSFLLIVRKDDFDEAIKDMDRDDVNQLKWLDDTTMFDIPIKITAFDTTDDDDPMEVNKAYIHLKERLGERMFIYYGGS